MAKILVVDDEAPIRMLIRKYAVYEGHEVDEAADGREAVRLVRAEGYDAVILDIMMPELDGLSACREIRRFSDVPILMLSARGEEYDKIGGFEFGADDYVVKPFSPRELMLRVEAILKRTAKREGAQGDKEVYTFGGLVADVTARIVTVDGERAELSPKEYDLLFYMIRNRGIALSREKLICDVWGYDFFGGDRTLDTHVKLLRKSLGPYSAHIVTLRGVGYRFDDEPQKD
ncbi:MAG: response regulator transcription factor [Clostridia bacterium]|nr:response regulator transcription factor [Clostridia bacterium]